MRALATLAAALLVGCAPHEGATGNDLEVAPDDVIEVALLSILGDSDETVSYLAAMVDLDGDGADEIVAHLEAPSMCGSGGCQTIVLTPDDDEWRVVSWIGLTKAPIFAAEASTNGWRDLLIYASGGIEAGVRRLSFDGTSYPDAPSGDPVEVSDSAEPLVSFDSGAMRTLGE